jgi:murein DD-endopeptidase MepM/ murein hydrolase activator NlpD
MTERKPSNYPQPGWSKKKSFLKNSLAGSLIIVLIACLILFLCRQSTVTNNSSFTVDQQSAGTTVKNDLYEQSPTQLFTYIVKPGDTFAGILSKFNIPEKYAIPYYASLKSVGLSALFPGDSLILVTDEHKMITKCSLCSKLLHWYHIHNNNNTLHAEKKSLNTTKYLCVIKGSIETSLYEDMLRQGAGDALVFKLTDIFAWDINFFMDPRRGDIFEVLFEKKYREGQFVGYGSILSAKYKNGNKTYYAVAMKDSANKISYYDLKGKSLQKQFLKAPLNFRRISSRFSYSRRHPILGIYRPHLGIDYVAQRGTPVYSSADGIVLFTGYKGEYGNHIRISHGASYQTYYGHLHRIQRGIRKGVQVKQGQFIGTVGSTGLSTGPHLDYRMKIGSRFINPLTLSLPSKEGISEKDMDEFERIKRTYLFTLEERFKKEGCYVVDIIQPKPSEVIISKTTQLIVENYGHPTSS